jgi:hypothetical protein
MHIPFHEGIVLPTQHDMEEDKPEEGNKTGHCCICWANTPTWSFQTCACKPMMCAGCMRTFLYPYASTMFAEVPRCPMCRNYAFSGGRKME